MIVREGSEVWLYVILWLMMIAAAASCLGMIVSLVGWFVGRRRRGNAGDAPWRQKWQLKDTLTGNMLIPDVSCGADEASKGEER